MTSMRQIGRERVSRRVREGGRERGTSDRAPMHPVTDREGERAKP